jgi:hypothetical protein
MLDRESLVRRHNIVITDWHPSSTLSLGNGNFGVNVDVTGLQTFPDEHELPAPATQPRSFDRDDFPVPLRIQSNWGWYRTDAARSYELADASSPYETARGPVPYPDGLTADAEASRWLFNNPRRLDLGRIGLEFDGSVAQTRIELDMWAGVVHSTFTVDGYPVSVRTVVHPDRDVVATRITSPLLADGALAVVVGFPDQRDHYAPFERFAQHGTKVRTVGDMTYYVDVCTDGTVDSDLRVTAAADELSLAVSFSPTPIADVPDFAEVHRAATAHWPRFWRSGAAVSFAGSTDPRATELERRVVLSQYLTAVHCSGSLPPQETGFVNNSWEGQFHLEMHWWHAAHFVLWGRPELLERSLEWYREILPRAREYARWQGYAGVRWPKQIGPDAIDAPCETGPFLIWQQPHPIYYAELLWQQNNDPAVLEQYRDLVFVTAEFMADYPDLVGDEYHLGPPVIPAQETYTPIRARTADPAFELAYWYWGIHTAQQWRIRLGLSPDPQWTDVLERLTKPLVRNGIYAAVGTEPYTYRNDHPSMLMALGFVPGTPLIERDIMSATYDDVLANWDWFTTWGWDFPVLAMCATKLGRPHDAVDALLRDAYKNHFLVNGQTPQYVGILSVYLPSNGGLLAAIAMMIGGWDGLDRDLPGFPDDGSWHVEHEGFHKFPADIP